MVTLREATVNDSDSIALIHTISWQRNYQGILTDTYLQKQIAEDRMVYWRATLSKSNENRFTLLAEESSQIIGFSCTYTNYDDQYEAYIDNLHVLPGHHGKGIGKKLVKQSARWVKNNSSNQSIYLWVWEANQAAQAFYKKIGAHFQIPTSAKAPDGHHYGVVRCVWPNLQHLIDL